MVKWIAHLCYSRGLGFTSHIRDQLSWQVFNGLH